MKRMTPAEAINWYTARADEIKERVAEVESLIKTGGLSRDDYAPTIILMKQMATECANAADMINTSGSGNVPVIMWHL